MRVALPILLFVACVTLGTHLFPPECLGAIRITNWTVLGPGGRYGLVQYLGGLIVLQAGPLGGIRLYQVVCIGLSGIVALAAFVLWPKSSAEKDDGPVRFT